VNPLIPAPRYKYSLGWAASVIDELVVKHERAAEMICRVYALTRYDLVKYLASADPLFPFLRERIKYLALCEERTGKAMDYLTVVEWCEGLHGTKFGHGQAERLDKRRKELRIKEQGSRGGGGCSEAKAEPSLPTSPPVPPSPSPSLQLELSFGG